MMTDLGLDSRLSIASGFMDAGTNAGDVNGSGSRSGSAGGRKTKTGVVRRWDGRGAAGAEAGAEEWDRLQKDPELWVRKGNCLIHLHSKGTSTNGPSFKLPFAALLKARCYPLIQRFLVLDGTSPQCPSDILKWYHRDPKQTIELYIPPPPMADASQARHYHLCTRNLIAWVLSRPLVGEYLGCALVGLLNSMHEFRDGSEDNVADLMTYLGEQGYLDLAERPDHALAVMRYAETFQLRGLYIRAFCHCVGMSEVLHASTEYENVMLPSRRLIRQARQDMDSRLTQASSLLHTFLDDELSESHLGIPSGARAHLEHFRTFLLSFYSTKLGYYPPRAFDPETCQAMGDDFAALYELLVDDEHACSETSMPSVAVGGICTLQLVQTFDQRKEFEPLRYPLPLLPQIEEASSPGKRMGWLMRREKGRANQRLVAHMALINASNWRETTFRNDLVKAYRKFEEACIVAPSRVDKNQKVSLADARKIRWIMVYAIHQVLRSVNQWPTEVSGPRDEETSYHLAVSTKNLPPWDETAQNIGGLLRSQTELVAGIQPEPHVSWGDMGLQLPVGTIEIKPDIDYFALTHQETPSSPSRPRRASASFVADSAAPMSRSASVTRALTRSSTLRRSMRIFRPATASPVPTAPVSPSQSPAKQVYQEIVVHGYGNGTNDVRLEAVQGVNLASRSGSTASQANSSVSSARESTNSWAETVDSSVKTPSPTSPYPEVEMEMDMKARKCSRPDMYPTGPPLAVPNSTSTLTQHRRLMSTVIESGPHSRASSYMGEPDSYLNSDEAQHISPPGPPPQASFISRHSMTLPDLKRRNTFSGNKHTPPAVRIRDSDADEMEPRLLRKDSLDWTAMEAFIDGSDVRNTDALPAWEQYAELGGLTEMT